MHTSMFGNTRFTHSSDFSGDVKIITKECAKIEVPFDDLKQFIASYVRGAAIARLEQADADTILNVRKG